MPLEDNQKNIKFCVVYRFDVKPGQDAEFKKLWREITLEIRKHASGLGSRLHQVVDKPHTYVAYAQWPNREAWLNRAPANTTQAKLLEEFSKICKMTVVYQLDVIDDLIK